MKDLTYLFKCTPFKYDGKDIDTVACVVSGGTIRDGCRPYVSLDGDGLHAEDEKGEELEHAVYFVHFDMFGKAAYLGPDSDIARKYVRPVIQGMSAGSMNPVGMETMNEPGRKTVLCYLFEGRGEFEYGGRVVDGAACGVCTDHNVYHFENAGYPEVVLDENGFSVKNMKGENTPILIPYYICRCTDGTQEQELMETDPAIFVENVNHFLYGVNASPEAVWDAPVA